MKNYPLFFLLGGLLICAFLADIAIGSVNLSLSDVWATLTGNSDNLIYHEIILNHRLPKAITAILAGGALSVAGVHCFIIHWQAPTYWELLPVPAWELPYLH